jgi:hypothetical protein
MKKPIIFDQQSRIIHLDKRYLKKHGDYGYYMIIAGLIHYFDKNKKYETSKIYSRG